MGKGPRRKPGDQPRIRITTLTSTNVTENSVEEGFEFSPDACKVSFKVFIEKSPFTAASIPVTLKLSGSRYVIMVGDTAVGKLNSILSQMVINCSKIGISYTGKIFIDDNTVYAKFTRVA